MHNRFDELRAAKLRVVPISVDPPKTSVKLAKRLKLTKFSLYSDSKGSAAQAWNVWDGETEIALAASFIVDKGGKVLFRYIGADKTDRPGVDEFLRVVK